MKTKISTEVRDSDTTFKVKSSRSPGRFTHRSVYASGSCSCACGNVLAVGNYCYVAVCRRSGGLGRARRFGANRGRRGAGHIGRPPPTACYLQNWMQNSLTMAHIIKYDIKYEKQGSGC